MNIKKNNLRNRTTSRSVTQDVKLKTKRMKLNLKGSEPEIGG